MKIGVPYMEQQSLSSLDVLVEVVLSVSPLHSLEVGDVVTQFLYSAHRLLKKLTFQEISELKQKTLTLTMYIATQTQPLPPLTS